MRLVSRYWFVGLVLLAVVCVAAIGLNPAAAGNFVLRPHPLATTVSGSDANAIFSALNTNNTGGGIEGQVGASLYPHAAGAGVFGIFNSASGTGEGILGFATNGSGVIAESFGGTAATLYSQNYSPFAGPALQGVSNGNGIVGQSADTNAIVGITSAPPTPSSAAVLGEDTANTDLFNNGVTGTTTNDGWGVQGTSQTNALGGVEGLATSGVGVEGASTTNLGIYGNSGSSIGVEGFGGVSSIPGSESADVGVDASSTNANGLYAVSTNRNGAAIENSAAGYYTLYVVAHTAGGDPIGAFGTGGSMVLDGSGNLSITGLIHTGGSCSSGCSVHHHPSLYAPTESQPTTEDFGEGQLVSGQAYVHLDPAFANVIDARTNYLVFITPEGDSNGVYVTQKTLSGFTVKENRNGHSTLAFSYRIVAKPYADNSPRLPMVDDRANLAAMRMGASDSRALYARATTPVAPANISPTSASHWSALKQAIARNPFLTTYHKDRIPNGPPDNVRRAESAMKLQPH